MLLINRHNYIETRFYDNQSKLKELNKQILKLEEMNHHVSLYKQNFLNLSK